MQKMIILFAFFFIAFIACEKSKLHTVSGHIYESCGVPAAKKTFSFYQAGYAGSTLGTTTTDVDGKFSLTYSESNGTYIKVGIPRTIGYSEYGKFEENEKSDVKLYGQPTTFLRVRMQVYNNTYTSRDTLFIGNAGGTNGISQILKFSGPFDSKTLYEIPNYKLGEYAFQNTYLPLIYRLNEREINQGNVKLNPCDTSAAIVEIR